jgi:hypothetical protein
LPALAATKGFSSVSQDINVLALVKGEERYIFLFDDDRRAEALRTLGRFASNPELSFSWYDAAVLSQRIRSTLPEGVTSETVGEKSAQAAHSAVPRPHRPRFTLPLDTAADSLGDEV